MKVKILKADGQVDFAHNLSRVVAGLYEAQFDHWRGRVYGPSNFSEEITKEASKIHGITNKIMRQKGINIKPVLREIINDIRLSHVIVAHNINFDISYIKIESFRNGLANIFNTLHIKEYDTMLKG